MNPEYLLTSLEALGINHAPAVNGVKKSEQ